METSKTDALLAQSDPRVYFAAERTLLSWLRLGIGIMAFGFVIARFGLFVRMLHPDNPHEHSTKSSIYIGGVLCLLGVVSILVGALRYRKFCNSLPEQEIPSASTTTVPVLLCVALALLGTLLFVQLTYSVG